MVTLEKNVRKLKKSMNMCVLYFTMYMNYSLKIKIFLGKMFAF